MDNFKIKAQYNLEDYRSLMHYLRGPDGCPWDREQTHESIRRNLIEEAYETANAIDRQDKENLKEELGDLLMQVLFHAEIEEEQGNFNLDDIADAACKKLVFRHPHVFQKKQMNSEEALRTWEEQKKEEKGQRTVSDTLIGVTETLPALWRAEKIQKKANALPGGELNCSGQAEKHLRDTLTELATENALSLEERSLIIGKLLFAAVEAARAYDIDPETALHTACNQFIKCAENVEICGYHDSKPSKNCGEKAYQKLISTFYGGSGEES